ncbi:MAG: WhiB family transcriptional regulator [Mycobacteriales bacterium]
MSRPSAAAAVLSRQVGRDPRFRQAMSARGSTIGWRSEGLCLRHDPELFFPNAAEDPAPAMAICRACPVAGACLAAALEAGECDGVWGGTTPEERRWMRQAWTSLTPV